MASISPNMHTQHPLAVTPEMLSDVVRETYVEEAYEYWCSVAKKPNLIMLYRTSIPTLEELRKVETDRGLTMCSTSVW